MPSTRGLSVTLSQCRRSVQRYIPWYTALHKSHPTPAPGCDCRKEGSLTHTASFYCQLKIHFHNTFLSPLHWRSLPPDCTYQLHPSEDQCKQPVLLASPSSNHYLQSVQPFCFWKCSVRAGGGGRPANRSLNVKWTLRYHVKSEYHHQHMLLAWTPCQSANGCYCSAGLFICTFFMEKAWLQWFDFPQDSCAYLWIWVSSSQSSPKRDRQTGRKTDRKTKRKTKTWIDDWTKQSIRLYS